MFANYLAKKDVLKVPKNNWDGTEIQDEFLQKYLDNYQLIHLYGILHLSGQTLNNEKNGQT